MTTRAIGSSSASPVADYQLTQVKLARMAVVIQATRQFMYAVARLLAKPTGKVCSKRRWSRRTRVAPPSG